MNKLDEIIAWKKVEIRDRIRPVTERELNRWAEQSAGAPSFAAALRQKGRLAVISEIKRRSPSAGAIAENASASQQAERYMENGADAISVLTDEKYFGGGLSDLREAVNRMQRIGRPLPSLRKDFMLHPFQVIEAIEAGARAILIIVRVLDRDDMLRLFDAATSAGLDTLFEVHDERDVERALAAGSKIIGVNNRDLTRFNIDLAFSERIIPQLPPEIIKVSESGISSAADARRARDAGADAILVGEALMRAKNPRDLLRSLSHCQE